MNSLKTIVAASMVVLAGTVEAQINIPPADLTFAGTGYGATLTLGGSSTGTVGVGPFQISTAGVTVSAIAGKVPTQAVELSTITHTSLWFCMDPLQPWKVSGSSSNLVYTSTDYVDFNQYGVAPPSGLQNGISAGERTDLQTLFSSYFISAKTGILSADPILHANGLLTAAALQLAIWEVVNENNVGGSNLYNIATGNFKATGLDSSLSTTVTTMLTALNSYNNHTATRPANIAGGLDFLIDGSQTTSGTCTLTQDYVGWDESPVPEASTYGLAAMGLMGLAVAGRVRSQRAKLSSAI